MTKAILSTVFLMIMSIGIQAESINSAEGMRAEERVQEQINVKSVRGILGEFNPMEHTKGQLRLGYITWSGDGQSRTNSYALAGHYHFDTKRWNGLMIGASAYTVLNMGINQNPININGDFFDTDNKSFILFSKAFIDGKWGNTEIKLGRQALDTPHADSDDIRMMPNFFTAYTLTNNDINDLTLSAGFITHMAGWENSVNAPKFVNLGETLGENASLGPIDIDGIYYASASYEGIKDLSLSLWYYHYSDVADVIYAEAGYTYALSKNTTLTFGLQYDGSHQTGASLLGKQAAQTFGVSGQAEFKDLGLTVLAAYNQDNGNTGATGLSLGGGPLFTSMEDQTLDAIENSGKAWVLGAAYDFGNIHMDDLIFGVAYGHFEADDNTAYKVNEVDAVLEYSFHEKLSLTVAFSSVKDKIHTNSDYDQLRMIANYNF